jgi:hypothetical protein
MGWNERWRLQADSVGENSGFVAMADRMVTEATLPLRTSQRRPLVIRLLVAFGACALIMPTGPFFWLAICTVRAGGISSLINHPAHWEEFSYKWPAAFALSSLIAIVAAWRILFCEPRTGDQLTGPTRKGLWRASLIVLPGATLVGMAYLLESIFHLWFGVVFAFAFVCYLLILLALLADRVGYGY